MEPSFEENAYRSYLDLTRQLTSPFCAGPDETTSPSELTTEGWSTRDESMSDVYGFKKPDTRGRIMLETLRIDLT